MKLVTNQFPYKLAVLRWLHSPDRAVEPICKPFTGLPNGELERSNYKATFPEYIKPIKSNRDKIKKIKIPKQKELIMSQFLR